MLRSWVPEGFRQKLLWSYRIRRLLVGRRARRAYRYLVGYRGPAQGYDAAVPLRIRALHGRAAWVRPGTTDLTTLVDSFWWAYHTPPASLDVRGTRLIWDLGSNVGFTVAHLAHICPSARIVGVELDPENAEMARRNIEPWAERCEIVQAGVWIEDGRLAYRRDSGVEYGFRIAPLMQDQSLQVNASAPALSLNSLLSRERAERIDFVKMDIEGAESRVLSEHTEWAAAVKTIKVEVHEPYSVADCIGDLRALGFVAVRDTKHYACVIGTRHSPAARPGDGRDRAIAIALP
jgi:FkbM family methyltransferase